MTTRQLSNRHNGHTVEEEEQILQQRQDDIERHGYSYAFKQDSVMTFEKAEWLKKNNRLGGKSK